MSSELPKPIFVAVHPRACSTAFERVFMACQKTLECIHEPFGDAFYFGPERLGERYGKDGDRETRERSGFAHSTYRDVFDAILRKQVENPTKRILIKDIAHYLSPPRQAKAQIAPSMLPLATKEDLEDTANPTVLPRSALARFHFTFLIRHPRRSVPSYIRCCRPPLVSLTGFEKFMPSEMGYDELRRLFDYLVTSGLLRREEIVVLDADDMLNQPEKAIRAYCDRVGLEFHPSMLVWTDEDTERAAAAFAKWRGFHEDAISSSSLKPRSHALVERSDEEEDRKWEADFGKETQQVMRETVKACLVDYEYLKSFSLSI